ncbi:isochorismatase family protein [Pseudomonas sp. RAC1]|uniref:isochorismatase family protein n=1 Tax=Pseudomonas sp. RAC1 TaxID=3064900 RepID=UPI0027278D6A|nr:isochorismatase family protein [Pseudomonas sp. RAC1]MDV9033578.1 isochorismatase family protein [Pseudomonas sp. RAC1]
MTSSIASRVHGKTTLIINNMQVDLLPMIQDASRVLEHCCWLAELAQEIELPVTLTCHEKLGALPTRLRKAAGACTTLSKCHFNVLDVRECDVFGTTTPGNHWIFAGVETHVCILQSALALRARGDQVSVVVDAVSSRSVLDHEVALSRMARHGVELITREMLFFETMAQSERSDYLALSQRFLDGRYLKTYGE